MGPLVRLGLSGRLGSGRQWWSYISLRDHVAATLHLLADDSASGPYNLTSPHPCTNAEATKAMGAPPPPDGAAGPGLRRTPRPG